MTRKHWHPAFCGATEWELKDNKSDLLFEPEHLLNKEPIRTDLLIIKKNPDAKIKNEIGRIFRQNNIIEYKGAGDGLSIDTFFKTMGYACVYKGLGKHVNEIPADELTVTIIREAYPKKLFKLFPDMGITIKRKYPGIYYLGGKIMFSTQIIVTRELDGKKHASLKILSNKATEEDVRRFLQEANLAKEPEDLQNISAVLQLSVSANQNLYEAVRRDQSMCCEALRELMKDEIEEAAKNAAEKATETATESISVKHIRELMRNLKMTAEQAMQALGIAEQDRAKYAVKL